MDDVQTWFGYKAITWTNGDLLSIWPIGTNFSAIRVKVNNSFFKKMHLNILSSKSWPCCSGVIVLKLIKWCILQVSWVDHTACMDYMDPTEFSGLNWRLYISNWTSGPLFTKKTPSYQYRNSHYKPETVVRPSEVYHGDPCTRKTTSS